METVDERLVKAPVAAIFALSCGVGDWPVHLPHYRFVRFHEQNADGGGIVEMSANRPFGPVNWPTWWCSLMSVIHDRPSIRFRHVQGVTAGMEVEWTFKPVADGSTIVRIVHVWDGPRWPVIGGLAAVTVIGPVFVHGIATRTLAGLAAAAEASNSHGRS
ncbi:MAG: hypothetical protein NVS1B4_03530 [Gemmatimonadaceae bacterium]